MKDFVIVCAYQARYVDRDVVGGEKFTDDHARDRILSGARLKMLLGVHVRDMILAYAWSEVGQIGEKRV